MKKCFLIYTFLLIAIVNIFPMHIMEGFLPVKWSIGYWIFILPFLFFSLKRIKSIIDEKPELKIFLAMAGAFVFVLSSLKIPSLTGSCSHPTGTGFGALLFGPTPMVVISFIVLLFQALLLAHGGLTTLGANTVSMGIAGPFGTFFIYHLLKKVKLNNNVAIFLAASLGDLITYCVTSAQLAFSYPDPSSGVTGSLIKFLGVFAVTQIPLAISEGVLTVLIINALRNLIEKESPLLSRVSNL